MIAIFEENHHKMVCLISEIKEDKAIVKILPENEIREIPVRELQPVSDDGDSED